MTSLLAKSIFADDLIRDGILNLRLKIKQSLCDSMFAQMKNFEPSIPLPV